MYVRHSWEQPRATGSAIAETVGKGRESTRARTKHRNAWQKSPETGRGTLRRRHRGSRIFDCGRSGARAIIYFMVPPNANPSINDYRGHHAIIRGGADGAGSNSRALRRGVEAAFGADKESGIGSGSRSCTRWIPPGFTTISGLNALSPPCGGTFWENVLISAVGVLRKFAYRSLRRSAERPFPAPECDRGYCRSQPKHLLRRDFSVLRRRVTTGDGTNQHAAVLGLWSWRMANRP